MASLKKSPPAITKRLGEVWYSPTAVPRDQYKMPSGRADRLVFPKGTWRGVPAQRRPSMSNREAAQAKRTKGHGDNKDRTRSSSRLRLESFWAEPLARAFTLRRVSQRF